MRRTGSTASMDKATSPQRGKSSHRCREARTCCCYQLADEPNERCPVHGFGEWPPRWVLRRRPTSSRWSSPGWRRFRSTRPLWRRLLMCVYSKSSTTGATWATGVLWPSYSLRTTSADVSSPSKASSSALPTNSVHSRAVSPRAGSARRSRSSAVEF